METLRPVEVSEYYISRVAAGLSRYFWDNLFQKIFEILKSTTVYNSKDDVINALRNGSIWYENGAFRTKTRFTNGVASTLEKMGAKFKYNAYYIEKSLIPLELGMTIDYVAAQGELKATYILDFLSAYGLSQVTVRDYIESATDLMFRKLQVDIIKAAQDKQIPVIELGIVQPKVTLPKQQTKDIDRYWKEYDKKSEKIQKEILKAGKKGEDTEQLKEDLKQLQKDAFDKAPQLEIELNQVALDEQSKKIAQDYTYNMQYWVKKWEVKNIIKMRQDVLKMIQEGARVPRLTEYFEKRWGIARSKANFLAINESHLAASVIKATQYQMMGTPGYVWGRSSSKEKRELHKHYYNKFFTWDNKPIIDEELGIKGYPRQIWNCKCHMLVVVPTLEDLLKRRTEVKNERNFFKRIQNSTQRNNNAWRYRRFGQGQTF